MLTRAFSMGPPLATTPLITSVVGAGLADDESLLPPHPAMTKAVKTLTANR
jgi:hypothetical protein